MQYSNLTLHEKEGADWRTMILMFIESGRHAMRCFEQTLLAGPANRGWSAGRQLPAGWLHGIPGTYMHDTH